MARGGERRLVTYLGIVIEGDSSMFTHAHLARIIGWAIVSSCLSVATCYAAGDTTPLAQAGTDAEMSTISGDAANPRRHYRLRDPKSLDPERAAEIYTIARAAMGDRKSVV